MFKSDSDKGKEAARNNSTQTISWNRACLAQCWILFHFYSRNKATLLDWAIVARAKLLVPCSEKKHDIFIKTKIEA